MTSSENRQTSGRSGSCREWNTTDLDTVSELVHSSANPGLASCCAEHVAGLIIRFFCSNEPAEQQSFLNCNQHYFSSEHEAWEEQNRTLSSTHPSIHPLRPNPTPKLKLISMISPDKYLTVESETVLFYSVAPSCSSARRMFLTQFLYQAI